MANWFRCRDGNIENYNVNMDKVSRFFTRDTNKIIFKYDNNVEGTANYNDAIGRDKDFERLTGFVAYLKAQSYSTSSIKTYFAKHQDLIYTLAVVILIDHFVFHGTLRARIQATVEKLLGKIA